MAYLIYNTEEEAKERSALAGAAKGLSFHVNGMGTKYWWIWIKEPTGENPRAAIVIPTAEETNDEGEVTAKAPIEKDLLTESEIDNVVDSLPEDWATIESI
mgnify:CR=1 FL=1|jgi:hypothetical protein|tara:strand:- start:926 stop:1228 length:303 start_codon:yes stop_codon:yes gene_type:complete